MEQRAYLILENGTIFEGRSFGASGEVTGEVVFTTAMTGYLETLTDPSYYGQIVVQTFPLIGNYGVIPSDFESSQPHLKGYIVREWCQQPSNFRADEKEGCLDTFLKDRGVVGLYGIDTRALTRIVREHGVMNGRIVPADAFADGNAVVTPELLKQLKEYRIVHAVQSVGGGDLGFHPADAQVGLPRKKVVLWDFGAKANICRNLNQRGCDVWVVPSTATAEEILAMNPHGIMLSNGPGDPAENVEIIEQLAKLCEAKKPTFGICLGHQLLALSQGAKTAKLKYGHRGANQPAVDRQTGRVYITSQNHGYAVLSDTLPSTAKERFANANDNSCEGVDYLNMPAFSVQFHPEAAAGPLDTAFLFDRFIAMMEGESSNAEK